MSVWLTRIRPRLRTSAGAPTRSSATSRCRRRDKSHGIRGATERAAVDAVKREAVDPEHGVRDFRCRRADACARECAPARRLVRCGCVCARACTPARVVRTCPCTRARMCLTVPACPSRNLPVRVYVPACAYLPFPARPPARPPACLSVRVSVRACVRVASRPRRRRLGSPACRAAEGSVSPLSDGISNDPAQ